MTSLANAGVRSYPNGNGVAAAKYLRVSNNSGDVALAGQGEELGVLEMPLLAADDVASVRHLKPGETVKLTAVQAITANADVYRAAGGKITDAQFATEDRLGIALEAGSGDGSVIEVLVAPRAPTTSAGTTTTAAP